MTAATEATAAASAPGRVARAGAVAPRTIAGRAWADMGVVAVLTLIGLLGFGPAFRDLGYLLAGVGGLLVGGGVAVVAARYRLGALVTTATAIVAYFLLGSAFSMPTAALGFVLPTLQTLAGLAVGAVFGWADIVTLRPPVSLPYYIDVVAFVATWLVMLVGATLATRWLPGRRRTVWRLGLLLVGPVVVYAAGVLLGTDEPYFAAVRGVAFAAIALIWLGWRRPLGGGIAVAGGRMLLRRKLIGTAILVLGAIAVGAVGGALLAPSSSHRFVLRQEVQPPFEPLDYPAPLAGFRHYTKDLHDTDLFRVGGLKSDEKLRIATMDAYDGVVWGVAGAQQSTDASGEFRLVGRDFPKPGVGVESSGSTSIDVSVLGYQDVWVPSTGYATTLDFGGGPRADLANVRYNGATGTTVLTTGLQKGQQYRLAATDQKLPPDQSLQQTPVATLQQPPITDIPDTVRAKAADITKDERSPIDKLRAVEKYLKTNGFLSHGTASDQSPSRAGEGADRMAEMVTSAHMVGDQEQYSSLMALMARSLNAPARVVMGFAPKVPDGGGTVTVTGNDVTAWVEVDFQGVGWIPFFPTPTDTDVPQQQQPKPQSVPQPQVRQPPRTQNNNDDLVTPVQITDSDKKDDSPFLLPGWVVALALAVLIPAALILLPAFIVWLLKRRRARRRRAPGGDLAAGGAWDELVDRLSELGYPQPAPRTTRRMAAGELAPVTSPAVTGLAERTDGAVFAGAEVPDEEVEALWNEVDEVLGEAAASAGRRRRLLSRYRVAAVRRWGSRVARTATDAIPPAVTEQVSQAGRQAAEASRRIGRRVADGAQDVASRAARRRSETPGA
ncbi:transglutaminase family protein [Pseudolysinimonas sp.]|uniref:transglutaminase family protein n=1 Tax=Pseudolysinimonas sp. TaxID=2680009 RepID=UPI003F7D6C67